MNKGGKLFKKKKGPSYIFLKKVPPDYKLVASHSNHILNNIFAWVILGNSEMGQKCRQSFWEVNLKECTGCAMRMFLNSKGKRRGKTKKKKTQPPKPQSKQTSRKRKSPAALANGNVTKISTVQGSQKKKVSKCYSHHLALTWTFHHATQWAGQGRAGHFSRIMPLVKVLVLRSDWPALTLY